MGKRTPLPVYLYTGTPRVRRAVQRFVGILSIDDDRALSLLAGYGALLADAHEEHKHVLLRAKDNTLERVHLLNDLGDNLDLPDVRVVPDPGVVVMRDEPGAAGGG